MLKNIYMRFILASILLAPYMPVINVLLTLICTSRILLPSKISLFLYHQKH